MDKLAAMRVFITVADEQGFTAAARKLRLSKSAVSKQLADLEAELGVGLINRTTRKLNLTEMGRAYYERASEILARVDETEQLMRMAHLNPCGLLKVNAGVSFGIRHLGPAIAEFMALHPALDIDLALADRYVDVIDEGLDMTVRIGQLPDSSLIARKIGHTRRVLCASPGYLAKHGRPLRPQELKDHNCLSYSLSRSGNTWNFVGGTQPVSVEVKGNLTVNNGDVLRAAALAGIGIYYPPAFLVSDDLRAGHLVQILSEFEVEPHNIHAIYPPNRHLSAKVKMFTDFLAERFGNDPDWNHW